MRKHRLKKNLKRGALLAVALWVVLFFYGTPLPQKDAILPEILHGEPSQKSLDDVKPFTKNIKEYNYHFNPQATYTLKGLVVSLHHSDSWIDISHQNDPAQTVDVCVVWGPNISTNGYQEVHYEHGDWTCYYSWTTEYTPAFSGNFLSNNHLIPHNDSEARLIKSIKIGDQIELSGILTDYGITDKGGRLVGTRHTSLVRTDTGNGACEVLLLSSVKILKRNMPWRTPLMHTLVFLVLIWFVWEIYSEIPRYKARPETLTGKPHVENPFDIKNFMVNKKQSEVPPATHQSEGDPARNGDDTAKDQ